ncbi:hypothetical protein [Streptomyces abikoensis]|uniref:hypothetical protein n=1 Tax=Streptomyces abikoensis TaxID=97398 RepID=UPI00167531F4|nr:hypothetical protein [Streptomyces abikoensis]GGP55801.1 hypothetical protein GCM10010214_31240 [Streptomyces abikoensis]
MDPITWLRPEFKGREAELIHLSAAAELVGVSRSAVSNWATRHRNFPRIVLLAGAPGRRTKHVVREEFLEFARQQLNAPRGRPAQRKPQRPAATVASESVDRLTRRIERLTALEAQQAGALKRTRSALREAENRLRAATARLNAELAAARQFAREES